MGGAGLDSISDRMMQFFKYRNLGTQAAPVNSFVGNFSVNVSGVSPISAATYQTGIRWFEMRRTGDVFTVFDQGTHNLTPGSGASGLNNWMGSIAQDNQGNLALGFSQSGTGQRANIMTAGRTNNVMNSGILNEGEALFFASAGSQTSTSNRWGDYSAMNVDPVDDCTFWYTQEYYTATSNAGWSTRVGSFIFPSCTPAPKATIQGTITFCSSGLPVNQASVLATGGYNRVTGAPGTYSMTVAPGTYTVSANQGSSVQGSTTPSVTFRNLYNLESTFDGEVLEISIGGGAFQDIITAGGSFVTGGYNSTLSTAFGNPLPGRTAGQGFPAELLRHRPISRQLSTYLRQRLDKMSNCAGA
ncbi:hypothetical protein BH20ACI1_BH20ACI1_10470 [soil metagenome]